MSSPPDLFYAAGVKNRIVVLWLTALLVQAAAAQEGRAAREPYPPGVAAVTMITFGDAYATPIEIYDARITVIEVLRGKAAWERLRSETAAAKPAPGGLEYALARIRFEFSARGKPGDKSYALSGDQFIAFSSDRTTQYPPAPAPLPALGLDRTLHSGEAAEGWAVLLVDRREQNPLMAFRADVRLLSHTGTGPFFRLY